MNVDQLFADFPDNSRVWLYQTDRALNDSEIETVNSELNAFVKEWAAHGNKLWANAAVINPYFVVIAVNDKLTPPSGCSIDASVRKLKDLGKKLNADFFTRMKVTIQTEKDTAQIPFTELANRSDLEEISIFDPLVSTLGELRSNWPLKIQESSFKQFVNS
ncbi:MAG: hypothetical protein R3277_13365 [Brumimicrobium sp.]|nr:hypothetical protein [Brumimicrobium sp.]